MNTCKLRVVSIVSVAAAFLCAAISTSAQTADPNGTFQVYGAGTQSCGSWLADRGNLKHHAELSWVLGWLSASDAFMKGLGKPLRHTDAGAVSAWLDKYCREHPLKNLADASGELLTELAKPE